MKTSFTMITEMAFRNLARHKVKSIITIAAVMVSVCLYIFVDSWLSGINIDSERNIIIYEMGAAKLQSKAYFDKKDDLPMYENFNGWETYSDVLENAGYDSAPRFVFTGTMYSASAQAPMEIVAVEPGAEETLLRYSQYMESGRYIHNGVFEVAVGSMAADRLKVGIPQRPTRFELEGEIVESVENPGDRDFVLSLYEPLSSRQKQKNKFFASKEEVLQDGNERMVLKKNIPGDSMVRLWNILASTGRMSVRISTVIDMKDIPETISSQKFNNELLPVFTAGERDLFLKAYELDTITSSYMLVNDDESLGKQILAAMLKYDYSGAIRHVNQLVEAVVVGVINSPNPKTNANIAYIPLDVLQDETGLMLQGHVTELLIRKHGASDSAFPGRFESPGTINTALQTGLSAENSSLPDELGVFGWREYAADYLAVSAGDNISTRIMIAMLFVLSFIGIANTMLMAILERTKEIGMMRALGMTDGQLFMAYMIEAGLVGLIGSIFGIILGCLINIPMVTYGMDFSDVAIQAGGDFGYRITSVFRSVWKPGVIAGTGIVATLLSALMAYFPTLRAVRMRVTESLRFE